MPTIPAPSRAEPTATAKVEKMLDAAGGAHVDLWELEVRRRQLACDMAEYDSLMEHPGAASTCRRRKLERSMELGVDALATAFDLLSSFVRDGAGRGRS